MPSKKCEADGCTKWASFNQPGLKKPLFCRPHSHEGMVNVVSRQRCTFQNCPKQANFNHPGESRGLFCKDHIEQGMVDVRHKHCNHTGCPKQATCNVPGAPGGLFCGQHKLEGMVNVVLKRCAHDGCETFPSFGHPGQPGVQYCRLHKEPGMSRRTATAGVRGHAGGEQHMAMDPDRCAHPGCAQVRPAYCLSHYPEHEHDPMAEPLGEHAHLQAQDGHLQYAADGVYHHLQQQQQQAEDEQHMHHSLHSLENQAQQLQQSLAHMSESSFTAAEIAAWQQGLAHGMTGEPHNTYEQASVGEAVEDPSQVQYPHGTVTGHPHPSSGAYKLDGSTEYKMDPHHHQSV